MFRVLTLVLLLQVSVFTAASERAIEADIVWHERHLGKQIIKLSQYRNEEWGEITTVYRSKNFISSTAISTLSDGTKMVFWSEEIFGETELFYQKQKSIGDNSSWSEAKKVSNRCRECLAAAPVLDLAGVMWVFWTDNSDGQDDVFYSKFVQGRWNSPLRANAENNVPDIKPVAKVNEFGQVEVNWSAYSALSQRYEHAIKSFGIKLDETRLKTIVVDTAPSDIPFPGSMVINSNSKIHMSANHFQQTALLVQ